MQSKTILNTFPLGAQWQTKDPFLFCAYHLDNYPGGNENCGPNVSTSGRLLGQDFSAKDGWSMYHGKTVPGFPVHPHRGFETVSIVKQGLMDHADSLGGVGRFGEGDTQWLTAGKGIQHSEMFPLLKKDKNPMLLFQIWLNLPKASKFVDPHYKMLWREDIPVITNTDKIGNKVTIDVIAGQHENKKALDPNPNSWAADSANEVQIWTIKMDSNSELTIPASINNVNRTLYFYSGKSIQIDDNPINWNSGIELNSKEEVTIKNGDTTGYFLFLQGKPINEPKAQYGPFVMNTQQEIQDAMTDYQKTQFGGWPHKSTGPVHGKKGRFAIYTDGKEEVRG